MGRPAGRNRRPRHGRVPGIAWPWGRAGSTSSNHVPPGGEEGLVGFVSSGSAPASRSPGGSARPYSGSTRFQATKGDIMPTDYITPSAHPADMGAEYSASIRSFERI